jgi:glucokinase
MLLAGDVGGTSTRLALFELDAAGPRLTAEARLASRDFDGLEAAVAAFLAEHPADLEAAGFGVAGPVVGGRVVTTNLPWVVDAEALAAPLDLPRVALLNDLTATAFGLAALEPTDLRTLQPGAPGATGSIAVIAAGTGLGEAALFWDGGRHHPAPSEGGHTDFAPRDPLEQELLTYLMARFGHVSYERIVSGPGLVNVYEFLRDSGRFAEQSAVAERLASGDPAAAIAAAALAGEDRLCETALGLLTRVYGAEAGNLALKLLATGGVYVGGGIAPKILPALEAGAFLEAFLDKGRLRPLLERVPLHVILTGRVALLGAARAAMGYEVGRRR